MQFGINVVAKGFILHSPQQLTIVRIRDGGTTKIRICGILAPACVARYRNDEVSNLLTGLFMREVREMMDSTIEEALYTERILSMRLFQFSLDALDDAIYLKRYRFTKEGICKIVAILSHPSSRN